MKKIVITFPDGSKKEFDAGVTGNQIAESIGRSLAKNALSISVDGEVWDLSRPINHDSSIVIHTWDSPEGKATYWHSSAHLMAEAIESLFPGTKFGIGPAIENGFYYDIDMGDHSLTNEDLVAIESKMKELSARDASYNREEVSWDKAVDYFKKKGDQYKLELLNEFKNESISMYHQGNFTDLCYGPHIPSTGKIK
ncbi:MAG TPA: TGS domain-containing protein, partial [Bacteroidota bacterium]|nr:TGS domain-containing protein [Bacteroidota bacterium]